MLKKLIYTEFLKGVVKSVGNFHTLNAHPIKIFLNYDVYTYLKEEKIFFMGEPIEVFPDDIELGEIKIEFECSIFLDFEDGYKGDWFDFYKMYKGKFLNTESYHQKLKIKSLIENCVQEKNIQQLELFEEI